MSALLRISARRLSASGAPNSRIGTLPASRRNRPISVRRMISYSNLLKCGLKPSLVPKAITIRSGRYSLNSCARTLSSVRWKWISCDPTTPRFESTTPPESRNVAQDVIVTGPPLTVTPALLAG